MAGEDPSLGDDTLRRMAPARVFEADQSVYKEAQALRVNSIDFSSDGSRAVTAQAGGVVSLIDTMHGMVTRSGVFKDTGASQVCFTHAPHAVLFASNKTNDGTVSYYSFHDNRVIHNFSAHKKRVLSLCMSPIDDTFLTAGADGMIRLWDLRARSSVATTRDVKTTGAAVAYDPEGKIWVIARASGEVQLIDPAGKGPFFTFDPRHTGLSGTPEIRFSPDGRTIAVLSLLGEGSDAKSGGSTGDDAHSSKPFYMGSSVIMLDAFATGDAGALSRLNLAHYAPREDSAPPKHGMPDYKGVYAHCLDWTPDGGGLSLGCSDGTVRTWRLGSERTSFDHISTLHGHNSRVSALRWSPTTDLLMSADVHTVSWLPKPQ